MDGSARVWSAELRLPSVGLVSRPGQVALAEQRAVAHQPATVLQVSA
ncbi:MAG: hypothetical protein H6Q86_1314 [candidate division NC10 bacterium]|nr:hypothetical protein [candidate division NC10 bacterium]